MLGADQQNVKFENTKMYILQPKVPKMYRVRLEMDNTDSLAPNNPFTGESEPV